MNLTWLFIIITSAVSFYAWSNPQVYQRLMMNPYAAIGQRQYWRFITSGFCHAGYTHLGFNMFTLYFFGGAVEGYFGQILGPNAAVVFVLFYLSAVVVADMPIALKNKHRPGYNTLGASGAVSAMVFASIIFAPLNNICLFGILCLQGFILGVIFIIYSYYQGKNSSDNINHEAHLYGAIYGILFSIFIDPQVVPLFIEQVASYRLF